MPRKFDRRPLHLKLRVVVTRRMKVGTMKKLVQRAIDTGTVPPGIEIRWIDWRKGDTGAVNSGVIPEPVHDELTAWWGAMQLSTVKWARVDRGGEE